MNIAVYGGGGKALQIEKLIAQNLEGVECKYAIENKQFEKLGKHLTSLADANRELEIISVNKVVALLQNGELDGVAFPTSYHLFDWNEINDICKNLGFRDDQIYAVPIDLFSKEQLTKEDSARILTPYNKLEQLYHLDIHILDECNIKCKGCAHFAPLVENDVYLTMDEFTKNLDRLKELIPNINQIAILGGEPLLHPDLCEILKYTRKIYPYSEIDLVTNGTMLLSSKQELFDTIVANNIRVNISLYPVFKVVVEKWVELLNKNHVWYNIAEFSTFERRLWPEPVFDGAKMTKKCGHDLIMRHSHIGRCPMVMFTDYYNKRFGNKLPECDGTDIFTVKSGLELIEELNRPQDLCSMCCARDHCYEPWERIINDNVDENDWYMNLPKKLTGGRK